MGLWSKQLGNEGEEIACRYLEQNGYKIIERNFHSSHGEIDIVAEENNFLVFVEVKNYSFRSYGTPVGAIGRDKKQALIHAGQTYLAKKNFTYRYARFDVVSIYRFQGGQRNIKLFKNAFPIK